MKPKKLSTEFIKQCRESNLIARTGKDSKGNSYSSFGALNQAAWLGERAHLLLDEIERLTALLTEDEDKPTK